MAVGVDGTWQVDPAASNPINFPIRQWHSDFFTLAAAQNLLVTASFSMELVNPPDDGTPANTWIARYADGTPVKTDTGFARLLSAQCPPIPIVANYQKAVYKEMARLQSQAGLTPWLQFGEFLWWFFSSMSQPVGYCSYTDPISIGLANPHGMQTGDRVVVTGVRGCTSANGTWTITVTDAYHFTIPVSANGAWSVGTGRVVGGSMAYYDPVTAGAAQTALGRPLYRFTCQDDDPSVNGGADVNFLANQLKSHIDAIRAEVLAAYPGAQVRNPVPERREQCRLLCGRTCLEPSRWPPECGCELAVSLADQRDKRLRSLQSGSPELERAISSSRSRRTGNLLRAYPTHVVEYRRRCVSRSVVQRKLPMAGRVSIR